MVVDRDIAHDRDNIFIEQSLSEAQVGYCLTLTARQGDSLWRRTIKRASIPAQDYSMVDRDGHSKDVERYWDPYVDVHTLQHRLAQDLGLPIPPDHPRDASADPRRAPLSTHETERAKQAVREARQSRIDPKAGESDVGGLPDAGDIDAPDDLGMTPLAWAVARNDVYDKASGGSRALG